MPGDIPLDLVSEIRTLAESVAPRDPDAAVRRFEELVRLHGRVICGVVLSYVAPEVGDLL